jgi:hypothetical protein
MQKCHSDGAPIAQGLHSSEPIGCRYPRDNPVFGSSSSSKLELQVPSPLPGRKAGLSDPIRWAVHPNEFGDY